VQTTPTLLVVGRDPKLVRECETALAGLSDAGVALHHVDDRRRAVEAGRSRHPILVLVEMDRDVTALRDFADEVATASPGTAVAAVLASELITGEAFESALIIEAIRAGIQDFLRRPISSSDLHQLLDRLRRRSAVGPRRLGRIVSFIGNKGGVGKSTLAVNVACGLATRFPERVLLVDASLQMGVCATMLDLRPTTTISDAVHERHRLDETLLRQLATPHECGLHLLASPSDPIEAAMVDDEIISRILTLARRTYDYVIVDSFPMFDRIVMAILDLSDRAYLVVESVVPTILGAARCLRLLGDVGFRADRIRIVLNKYMNFAGNLKPSDVERQFGRPVDHLIPYKKELIIAANVGRPFVFRAGRLFGFGRALQPMIDDLSDFTLSGYTVPAESNGAPRTAPEIEAAEGEVIP
jgi:pilus assembly protein CpaE